MADTVIGSSLLFESLLIIPDSPPMSPANSAGGSFTFHSQLLFVLGSEQLSQQFYLKS